MLDVRREDWHRKVAFDDDDDDELMANITTHFKGHGCAQLIMKPWLEANCTKALYLEYH